MSSLDYRIRSATVADVGELLRLIKGLAEYEKLSDAVIADEARLAQSLFGPIQVAFALLLEVGDESARQAVGFAVYFRNYSTFRGRHGIYLEDLFVEQAYRGRGYGRALLQAVAQQAAAEDCDRLEWSVLDWNAPSIAFYQSLGAKALDDWTIFRMDRETLRAFAGAPSTR